MSTAFPPPALAVLTVNCGSSSLKASLFDDRADRQRSDFRYGQIGAGGLADHGAAMDQLLIDLGERAVDVIAHRMTHGGPIKEPARLLDSKELERLTAMVELAPLHLPHNLRAVALCAPLGALQIACYDTSFHADLPAINQRLPLPEELGIYRCGFHGLNYAHIAQQLPDRLGAERAKGRILIAHLGSGSSLCLLKEQRSCHTSMGWTPLGGVAMGTRTGDLDPGIALHLLKTRSFEAVQELFWQKSGLLALSGGRSSQMQILLDDPSESAQFAVDYYCCRIAQEIGAMASCFNGLDALIFTGGIGENAPSVRERICQRLQFLGFFLDESKNQSASARLQRGNTPPILLIRADEERYMQQQALQLVSRSLPSGL